MKLFRSFLNDDDGFSAKDYLMVTFGTIFLVMVVTAFIISLVGTLPAATISVIGLMDGVIIAIVTGVFGLHGIREFRNKPTQYPIESDHTSYNEVEPQEVYPSESLDSPKLP